MDARWMLAFDASCSTCREVSLAVERASAGKLEIVPLGRTDVAEWRRQALGAQPPWAPTLLRVDDGVRAWTGPGMAVPLVRRLGLRASVRVLGALGDLRSASEEKAALSRGRFLRLGGGAVMAAGALLAGSTPALAREKERSEALAWAEANAKSLPRTYDEVVAHTPPYRRAIYEASSPSVRSRLWIEQLTRRRAATDLSAAQRSVLDRALALARDESTFSNDKATITAVLPKVAAFRDAGAAVFDRDDYYRTFASLGPALRPGTVTPQDCDICTCSTEDDWCAKPARYCREITCAYECDQPHGCYCFTGCGTFWRYECNGYCERTT